MHYSHKIAIAVVAGALASGVVMVKRDAIDRLIHIASRKKEIKKLKDWHQSYLDQIDSYSSMEARQFVENNHEFLVSLAKRKGYAGAAIDRFQQRVRTDVHDFIVANHKSQVTKKYANYLYEVDRNHGLHADAEAKEYTMRADELAKKLREKGCHIDSLLTTLHVTKPE